MFFFFVVLYRAIFNISDMHDVKLAVYALLEMIIESLIFVSVLSFIYN
jgi:hypothetical protein